MFIAGIHPHRIGLACPHKPKRLVERNCSAIGGEHLLVKSGVLFKQRRHHLPPNPLPLKRRVDQHVRVVDNQMPIRNRVANSEQPSRPCTIAHEKPYP